MIRGYSDHAANERTFLAWVRTGIAVIVFGFVIEKFNLFIFAMANASSTDAGHRLQLERLSGPFGRWPKDKEPAISQRCRSPTPNPSLERAALSAKKSLSKCLRLRKTRIVGEAMEEGLPP